MCLYFLHNLLIVPVTESLWGLGQVWFWGALYGLLQGSGGRITEEYDRLGGRIPALHRTWGKLLQYFAAAWGKLSQLSVLHLETSCVNVLLWDRQLAGPLVSWVISIFLLRLDSRPRTLRRFQIHTKLSRFDCSILASIKPEANRTCLPGSILYICLYLAWNDLTSLT